MFLVLCTLCRPTPTSMSVPNIFLSQRSAGRRQFAGRPVIVGGSDDGGPSPRRGHAFRRCSPPSGHCPAGCISRLRRARIVVAVVRSDRLPPFASFAGMGALDTEPNRVSAAHTHSPGRTKADPDGDVGRPSWSRDEWKRNRGGLSVAQECTQLAPILILL